MSVAFIERGQEKTARLIRLIPAICKSSQSGETRAEFQAPYLPCAGGGDGPGELRPGLGGVPLLRHPDVQRVGLELPRRRVQVLARGNISTIDSAFHKTLQDAESRTQTVPAGGPAGDEPTIKIDGGKHAHPTLNPSTHTHTHARTHTRRGKGGGGGMVKGLFGYRRRLGDGPGGNRAGDGLSRSGGRGDHGIHHEEQDPNKRRHCCTVFLFSFYLFL